MSSIILPETIRHNSVLKVWENDLNENNSRIAFALGMTQTGSPRVYAMLDKQQLIDVLQTFLNRLKNDTELHIDKTT